MTYKANMKTFADLGQSVVAHKATAEKQGEENKAICEEKMHNYCNLAAEILNVTLKKGNLPTMARKEFTRAMMEGAGLDVNKKGVGQRYYNGAVGIVRFKKRWDIPTQANSEAIREALEVQNINSEKALMAAISDRVAETDGEKAAREWVGSITYRKLDKGEEYVDHETGETLVAEGGERVPNGFRPSKRDLDDLYEAIARVERYAKAFEEKADDIAKGEAKFNEVLAALEI